MWAVMLLSVRWLQHHLSIGCRRWDSRRKYCPSPYFRNLILSFNLVICHIFPVLCMKFSISGTESLIRPQILPTTSRSSQMIRAQSRTSLMVLCLPFPTLTMACSHLPLVLASAARTSVLHSSSVNTLSRMTAKCASYSGRDVFLKSTISLEIVGPGPLRKLVGRVKDAIVCKSIRLW